jgi:peptidoglycan/xylan/chitin deacetylase (PgdA/CDA1 family)
MPAASFLKAAKSLAREAIANVPLGAWQLAFPKDVIALGYHVVSDDDLPHLKYYPYKTGAQFEADVAFAVDRFRAVGYAEVNEHRTGGAPLPPRAILFTFDDGFAECYDVIRPILLKYGAGGVFFVTIDFLDDQALFFETKVSLGLGAIERMSDDEARDRAAAAGPLDASRRAVAERRLGAARVAPPATSAHRTLMLGLLGLEQADEPEIDRACAGLGIDVAAYSRRRPLYLTRERVRQLAADGFTIGGHGLAHRALQRMDPEGIEREIVGSCAIVRDLTGQATVPFAFPYDGIGIDRGLLAAIRQRHPYVGLIFDTQDLRREVPFIVDRVWTDPPPGDAHSTNLPRLLRRAWSRRQAWFRASMT